MSGVKIHIYEGTAKEFYIFMRECVKCHSKIHPKKNPWRHVPSRTLIIVLFSWSEPSFLMILTGTTRYAIRCEDGVYVVPCYFTPILAKRIFSPGVTMRSAFSLRYRVFVALKLTVCVIGLFCMLENSPEASVAMALPLASQVLTV